MAFVTRVVEQWLEREIAQWIHREGSIRQPIAPWVNALTMELHLAPHQDTETNIKLLKCEGQNANINIFLIYKQQQQ